MTQWASFPVTHGYITTYEGPNTDTPHFADDIGDPFHTPITAPLSGTVIQADYAAWGGEIFVKPDDPTLPEYYIYHPDQIMVSQGQHIVSGQEIALSGGENQSQVAQGLYPGALHPAQDIWSSGPHTHLGWFQSWYTVPETGTIVPYGPDPSLLLIDAMFSGNTPPSSGTSGSQAAPCAQFDVACQIRSAISGLGTSVQTYLTQNVGGFFLRLGVGALGVGLVIVGTTDIAKSLSGDSGNSNNQSQTSTVNQSSEKPESVAKSEKSAKSEEKSEESEPLEEAAEVAA